MAITVPILKLGSVLIASIQDALTDSDLQALQKRLLAEVIKQGAAGVVIDVSALDILDSYGTRMLSDIVAAIQLRGARAVVVGVQPEVALSMVLLGLSLPRVDTALDLDAGLELLRRTIRT